MVNIVIVSHSANLAEGVRELALQMVQDNVSIALAGGTGDPDNPIGTDVMKVVEAISSVYNPDGVVVLMDLGSALLSTEMALEFLPPEQKERVFLCEAPLVEGTLAAAVQASVGGSALQVMAEARDALWSKIDQLRPHIGEQTVGPELGLAEPMTERIELRLIVNNRLGLHARPAARFVGTANQYKSKITVAKDEREVNAKSINQVATLGVRQGDEILVAAAGQDAEAALKAIQLLAEGNFGDDEETLTPVEAPLPRPVTAAAGGWLQGIPASPGIAIGPAVHYRWHFPDIPMNRAERPGLEWEKLQSAIDQAGDEIQELYRSALNQVGKNEAAIFEAHRLILQDPELLEELRARIFDEELIAEAAWKSVIDKMAEAYKALPDAYMQARSADVQDVGNRVLGKLISVSRPVLKFEKPSILLAQELMPSDTANLDPMEVLAICTELGGATSHSAILARSLGIPAVVGMGAALDGLENGKMIIVDGGRGQLIASPTPQELDDYQLQKRRWLQDQEKARKTSQQRAITKDNHRVEIGANIGGPKDASMAVDYGAEGVGLFRTEFLFLDRDQPPSEDEQFQAYKEVAAALKRKPLIIRTLDVGGDKPLPYLDLGKEENPFLGWRGIRFCLDHPEIFEPQLRAILRASPDHNIKIMFPMISSVGELRRARALLNKVGEELRAAGVRYDDGLEVGVMIEVPAAVMVADQLASEVDFFSIGSNDLTQYTMAADRGNSQVAELVSPLQPAVLRMIHHTVQAAHKAGIWVGLCGELAGNTLAAPLLVGLGLDELSMSAISIPKVKEAVRALTYSDAKIFAGEVLAFGSLADVENALASHN